MARLRDSAPWLVALALAMAGGSYALAAATSSSSNEQIYACVTKNFGTLNLSNATRKCAPGTRKISWNAEGVRGLRGHTGKPGRRGEIGATGAGGPTGAPGSAGAQGVQGLTGADGATGAQGIPGAQGEPGADATPLGYGYVFNEGAQGVAVDTAISFSTTGAATGILHTAGSANITIIAGGLYDVRFAVAATEPNEMALFANGVVVLASRRGSGAGTQHNTGEVLVSLSAGDVLTLRSDGSAAAVTLPATAGGTLPIVNATMIILRLA